MRAYEFLLDDVRPTKLYHGTLPHQAEQILEDNEIKAKTGHYLSNFQNLLPIKKTHIDGFKKDRYDQIVNGVSFTRDPFFARSWTGGVGIVFVLDWQKLQHNYRIIPIDYHWNDDHKSSRIESEEFLIGNVKPLDKYLLSIEMSRSTFSSLGFDSPKLADSPYAYVLNHPLVHIVGDAWGRHNGKIIKNPEKQAA